VPNAVSLHLKVSHPTCARTQQIAHRPSVFFRILTYLVVVGIVSFIGYAVYLIYYAPTTKKAGPRKIKPTAVTDEKVDSEPVKGSGVYSEVCFINSLALGLS
jgi:hypothetical protein